jgi:hypothetical protein
MFQSSEKEKQQRPDEHENKQMKASSSHRRDYNKVMAYILVEQNRL